MPAAVKGKTRPLQTVDTLGILKAIAYSSASGGRLPESAEEFHSALCHAAAEMVTGRHSDYRPRDENREREMWYYMRGRIARRSVLNPAIERTLVEYLETDGDLYGSLLHDAYPAMVAGRFLSARAGREARQILSCLPENERTEVEEIGRLLRKYLRE